MSESPATPDQVAPIVIYAAKRELTSIAEDLERSMRRRDNAQSEIDNDLPRLDTLRAFVASGDPTQLEYGDNLPQLLRDIDAARKANTARFLDVHANPGNAPTLDFTPERAAVRTLQGLGYTHEGGVEWRPPIGKNVPQAFDTLKQAMHDDPEFSWSWHCNLAMPIKDRLKCSHSEANEAAADLMRHVFDVDMRKHEHWVELEDVVTPEERAEPSSMQELIAGIRVKVVTDGSIPADGMRIIPAHITPTIGRRVWFRPDPRTGSSGFICNDPTVPMDAGIVFVWDERMVNLDVCDHAGNHHAFTSVLLLQPGDTPPPSHYCEWMPYQKGAAK